MPVDDRPWAERHELAAFLSTMVPGWSAVAYLDSLSEEEMDDAALVEGIGAWDRIQSWVASRQADLVLELVRRPRLGSGGETVDRAAQEIAAALAVSRRGGQAVVERALELDGAPEVFDALARGQVSVRKAETLLTETAHLSADDAAAVRREMVPQAGRMTVPQLRRGIRRCEAQRDPGATQKRHVAAVADRGVRMEPAPDAMAWIHAFLPAVDAMRVMTGLDAMAAAAAPQDDRTADQRRADALTDAIGRYLDAGVDLSGAPLPTRGRRRPHVAVTMSVATATGLEDGPVELAGYGLIPSAVGREVLAEGLWSPVAVHPATGEVLGRCSPTYRPSRWLVEAVVARDVTCTAVGCRVPADRCDVDHVVPFDPERDAAEQTRLDNLQALCRHHHRMKTFGGWSSVRDPATGVTRWTSPTGQTYTRDPVPAAPGLPLVRPPRPTVDAAAVAEVPTLRNVLRRRLDEMEARAREAGQDHDAGRVGAAGHEHGRSGDPPF